MDVSDRILNEVELQAAQTRVGATVTVDTSSSWINGGLHEPIIHSLWASIRLWDDVSGD